MHIDIHEDQLAAVRSLAGSIAEGIRQAAREGRHYVLGLATGASPIGLYEELIRLHRSEGLSFAGVVTFNLDEYYGLPPEDPNSYHEFMRSRFFSQVDLPLDQTHLPGGLVARDQVQHHCDAYEAMIDEAGGIDLQILGIGRTGHIGFNEPPSPKDSRTRLVTLDPVTRIDAAPAFSGLDHVPTEAITMGVSTILRSRRIVLMAWGERKAEIVRKALHDPAGPELPASFLRDHSDVTFLLDQAAASRLEAQT
ncbi:MAG: glucosamine-6-phosphate deaminase [Verrucomicrobiota bacterium]